MTREETKLILEVMKAFEQGERIKYRSKAGGIWIETVDPIWDWATLEYKIAQKEWEAWVDQFGDIVRIIRDKDDIADHSSHRRVTLVVKEEKE